MKTFSRGYKLKRNDLGLLILFAAVNVLVPWFTVLYLDM